MAFTKPFASKPIQIRGRSMTGLPHSTGKAFVSFTGANQNIDYIGSSGSYDSQQAAWNLGVGYTADCTGALIFNNETNGGVLSNVILRNIDSANTAYIGFNNTTPTVSGGIPLATGFPLSFDNAVITEIWAITASGLRAVITGEGLFKQDRTKIL